MKNWGAIIDLIIDAAAAYCQSQTRGPCKTRSSTNILFPILAASMLLTAIGFGLAAAYLAMISMGAPIACILTGAIALGIGISIFLLSRWLATFKDT